MRILHWIPLLIILGLFTWHYTHISVTDTSTISTDASKISCLSTSPLFACVRKSDSLKLIKLYQILNGQNWISKWDLNKPINTWWGVSIGSDGCVYGISLNINNAGLPNGNQGNGLKGEITYLELPDYLLYLDLSHNEINGNIENVKSLYLGDLNLSFNFISGSIPDLSKFPNLRSLYLNDNQFTGQIPKSNKLISSFNYSNNNLSGPIPEVFSSYENKKSLGTFYIFNNKFTFSDILFVLPTLQIYNDYIRKDCPFCMDTIDYSLQQPIYTDTTILIPPNTSYTLDLKIDDTVTTSTYIWYKNNVLYKTIKGSNKLPVLPFTSADAGTYTVKITNPLAPQLILESYPIRLVAGPSLVCDRRSDSLELVKFYNATGGNNWWKKWDLAKQMDSWWGVSMSINGCVEILNQTDTSEWRGKLYGNNLVGTLSDLNLPELKVLTISNNSGLTGIIPNFKNLPSLEILSLSLNNLIGKLPDLEMPNLKILGVSGNQLSDKIPNFSGMPRLQELYLGGRNMCRVKYNGNKFLYAICQEGGNNFEGALPAFDNIDSIQILRAGSNLLSGSIPPFKSNPFLKEIFLESNQLTGIIPDLTSHPNLEELHLSRNNLIGSVPNFSGIPKLKQLELSRNQLSGVLPNFNNLSNLQTFRIHNNQLSGSIPKFSNFPELVVLDLSENKYTNTIPLFGNTIKLQRLYFQNNNLYGDIPNFINSHPDLGNLTYEGNKFTFTDLLENNLKNRNLASRNAQCVSCQGDSLTYSPQQKIYIDTTILIPTNTSYTLDLLIDDTVTTSTYTWYKNNILFKTIKGSNKLLFTPFTSTDAGTYIVKITNPHAPQLTLESHPIRLKARMLQVNLSGKIYFTSPAKTNPTLGTIWSMNPDGTDITRLFNDKYNRDFFSASRDGRKLVYIKSKKVRTNCELGAAAGDSIYLCFSNIDGSAEQNVFHWPDYKINELRDPYLSIDNSKILFVSNDCNNRDGDIYIYDISLKSLKKVTTDYNFAKYNPKFNKDDSKIAHTYLTTGWTAFPVPGRIINVDGTSPKLFNPLNGGNYNIITFSNKSDRILYTHVQNLSSQNKMYLVNENGTNNNLIYTGSPSGIQQSFSPNEDYIAFGEFGSQNQLKIIDTNGVHISTYNTTENVGFWSVHWVVPKIVKLKIVDENAVCLPNVQKKLNLDFTGSTDTTGAKNGNWTGMGISNGLFDPALAGVGRHIIKYSVNIGGNVYEDTTLITVAKPISIAKIDKEPTCPNANDGRLNVDFQKISGSPPYLFEWIKSSGVQTGSSLTSVGEGNYRLILSDASGCSDTSTIITLKSPFQFNFSTNKDTYILKNNMPTNFDVLLNDTDNSGQPFTVDIESPKNGKMNYSNSSGKGSYIPNKNFSGKETISYKVCSDQCPEVCVSSSITFDIEPPCNDKTNLQLPTLILPNGSDINQYFIVEALVKCPDAFGPKPTKLTIFNRWGDKVYFTNDYKNDWNGVNQKGDPLPNGVYFYLLELGSNADPIKGYVAIRR